MGTLELLLEKLDGDGLESGSSVIFTFGIDTGSKFRTDPMTLTGMSTILSSRMTLQMPDKAKSMQVNFVTRAVRISRASFGVIGPRDMFMDEGRCTSYIMYVHGLYMHG
jgi:hypothetical protein